MTVFASKIELWRAAFPLVGEEPPASAQESSATAIVAQSIYEPLVRSQLTAHAWSFALKDAALTYGGPSNRQPAHFYPLPSDLLRLRYLQYADQNVTQYEVQDQKVFFYAETQELRAFYTWRAPESQWPADFATGIMHHLAALLASGPLERPDMAERQAALGDLWINKARVGDRSSSGPRRRNQSAPLADAWRGARTTRSVPPISEG